MHTYICIYTYSQKYERLAYIRILSNMSVTPLACCTHTLLTSCWHALFASDMLD